MFKIVPRVLSNHVIVPQPEQFRFQSGIDDCQSGISCTDNTGKRLANESKSSLFSLLICFMERQMGIAI